MRRVAAAARSRSSHGAAGWSRSRPALRSLVATHAPQPRAGGRSSPALPAPRRTGAAATSSWSAIDDETFTELGAAGRSGARCTRRRSTRCARAGARGSSTTSSSPSRRNAARGPGAVRRDRPRRRRRPRHDRDRRQRRTRTSSAATRTCARSHARAAAAQPRRPTRGGVIARFPHAVGGLPTLAVAAAERAGRPGSTASAFEADGAWIDYRGGAGHDPAPLVLATCSAAASTARASCAARSSSSARRRRRCRTSTRRRRAATS